MLNTSFGGTEYSGFPLWLQQHQFPILLAGVATIVAIVLMAQRKKLRFARFRGALHVLACDRRFVQVGLPILIVAIRLLLLPVWKRPEPAFLDEFSFLLMADTFASGRLINPPHPLWQHFETIFVLSQPNYGSVYPTASGAFLAAGQVLFQDPWFGVLVSLAFMLSALAWMFYGWLPPFWAFCASSWASLQIGLLSYWIDSYWGGSAAALGGALVLGALPRLRRTLQVKHAFLFAAGLCLLANSRPYEGLLLGTISTGYLLNWSIRQKQWRGVQVIRRLFVPVAVVLVSCMLWMGYYFHRVTGNFLEMPYRSYIKQYAASPAFIWQPLPSEPAYRHPVLREAHRSFLWENKQFDNVASGLPLVVWKLRKLATFYVGPAQILCLFALPILFKGRTRMLAWTVIFVVLGIMLTVSMQVHYAAPIAGAIFVLAVQSVRLLWVFRNRNRFGRFVVPALPALILLTLLASRFLTPPQLTFLERADLIKRLEKEPGNHLVIVQYGTTHLSAKEWVYNRADIDGARTVWARDMGIERNRELLMYYPTRRAWLLQADSNPPKLIPY